MTKLFLKHKYSLEARVFPTILGLIPFNILQYFYLDNLIDKKMFDVNIAGNISLSIVVIYFLSEFVVRYPAKLFEDKLFNKKLNFPTTDFLMFANYEYSKQFKDQIRERFKADFNIELPNELEEKKNKKEARKRIKESVGLIISKVKDGHLVLKQNISYGFFRNLWSASLVGALISSALILLSENNQQARYLGWILFIIYTLYLIFGSHAIRYFGQNYARKLIEEYSNGS